jgi:hypothetical protein
MTTLLLIAHPGHELRVLQWVVHTRPQVVMLTHGDGSIGQPRLADSRVLLERLGASVRSDWLEAVSDQQVYQAMLGRVESPLPAWLDQLFDACWAAGITTVVADAVEGYNPSHDICRVLANRLAGRLAEAGRQVLNLEVPLVGHPCDPVRQSEARVVVHLTPEQTEWKLSQMRDYARRCSPVLEGEVQKMIDDFGVATFATECLYDAVRTPYEDGRCPEEKPFFERAGEVRHAAGVYKDVIRATHLLRLAESLHGAD